MSTKNNFITVFLFPGFFLCFFFVSSSASSSKSLNVCDINPMYLRFSVNHSACKEDDSKVCRKTKIGVNEDDITLILNLHNKLRQRVATGKELSDYKFPPASNMNQMIWDNELAEVAQSHANQCSFEHDCNECRSVDDFIVGQNLYQRKTSWLNPVANWTKAIYSFYDEISFAPVKIVRKFKAGSYGHFSQVVWAETFKIGCGYASWLIDSNNTSSNSNQLFKVEELYVCNYGPSGNIKGNRMYRKGVPSSKCPFGTTNSTEFPGLCQVITDEDETFSLPFGPQDVNITSLRQDSLFYCDFNGAGNRSSNNSLKDDSFCPGLKIRSQNIKKNNSTNTSSFSSNAFLVEGLLDNYISFVLSKPGQKISLEFPSSKTKLLESKDGLCLESIQRKGSNNAKYPSNNSLKIKLMIPSLNNWSTEMDFGRDFHQWISSSVNINWSFGTKIVITFSVPNNGDIGEQFYEIKRLTVKRGRCNSK